MKRSVVMLIVVLFFGCFFAKAQTLLYVKKPRAFRTVIWLTRQPASGFLAGITDSSLQLSQHRIPLNNPPMENAAYKTYHFADIEKMKVWRYGKMDRDVITGFVLGAGVGAIVGLISYKKPEPNSFLNLDFGPGFSALTGAGTGGLVGIAIGLVAGVQKMKFNINGSRSRFHDMKVVVSGKAF